MPTKNDQQIIRQRSVPYEWTKEDDEKLLQCVKQYTSNGKILWTAMVRKEFPNLKVQCVHQHYTRVLRFKPTRWNDHYDTVLLNLYPVYGNSWKSYVAHLPFADTKIRSRFITITKQSPSIGKKRKFEVDEDEEYDFSSDSEAEQENPEDCDTQEDVNLLPTMKSQENQKPTLSLQQKETADVGKVLFDQQQQKQSVKPCNKVGTISVKKHRVSIVSSLVPTKRTCYESNYYFMLDTNMPLHFVYSQ